MLKIGWRSHDIRDSYWHLDPAFLDQPDPLKVEEARKLVEATSASLASMVEGEIDPSSLAYQEAVTRCTAAQHVLRITELGVSRIPDKDRAAWSIDGDAKHLRPYIRPGAMPARITFRTLRLDEQRVARAMASEYFATGINPEIRASAQRRLADMCFRIAVDFPDIDEPMQVPTGETAEDGSPKTLPKSRYVREGGITMLALEVVDAVNEDNPGLVQFYGMHVLTGSFPSEPEKKAS